MFTCGPISIGITNSGSFKDESSYYNCVYNFRKCYVSSLSPRERSVKGGSFQVVACLFPVLVNCELEVGKGGYSAKHVLRSTPTMLRMAQSSRLTDRCARAGRAPQAAATTASTRWSWRAQSRMRPHLPRRGRMAARRTGRGEARRVRPAAAAPRTTTRARRPARGQRALRGPGPSRDQNTRTVVGS